MADTQRPGGTGGISYPGGRTPVVADPACPGSSSLILDSVGLALLTEIVREFLSADHRTCVVHERNGAPHAARAGVDL